MDFERRESNHARDFVPLAFVGSGFQIFLRIGREFSLKANLAAKLRSFDRNYPPDYFSGFRRGNHALMDFPSFRKHRPVDRSCK